MIKIDDYLIDRLKDGYEDAFNQIYEAYEKMLYFLALSIVGDSEAAKDIVEEAFVKMFVKVHTLKQNCNFHFWIYKVTKNLAYDYLKEQKKQREIKEEDIDNLSLAAFERQFNFKLEFYLNKKDNLLVIYHICYGLGFREIGYILGLPYETVVKRYQRAVNKMRLFYLEKEEKKVNERS